MMSIHRLSKETIEKISAGEVIENPSDVLKELVENSIDAKASKILIEVKGGFLKLEGFIKVIDNGVGISKNDFTHLFERHSTSKITDIDDLANLKSLGFRGEALASIAQVSRVELSSRVEDEELGYKITCDNGDKDKIVPISLPRGVFISVSDIFKYLPVRLKFLKPDRVELNRIVRIIEHIALFHPLIDFELIVNQVNIFSSPRSDDNEMRRLIDLFGFNVAERMIEARFKDGDISVDGFISKVDISKGDSKSVYLAVNQRPIFDRELLFTVMNAYKGLLPTRRYPILVLNITIPPDMYDVNVHSRKSEVRFKELRRVSGLLYNAISKALGSSVALYVSHNKYENVDNIMNDKVISNVDFIIRKENHQEDYVSAVGVLDEIFNIESGQKGKYEFIGWFGNRYLMLRGDDEVFIVDQHSSSEAILYKKLMDIYKNTCKRKSQFLVIPKTVYLTSIREVMLSSIKDELVSLGYVFEHFGDKFILLRAHPSILPNHDEVRLLEDLLDGLDFSDVKDRGIEYVVAKIACHSGLRSNRRITSEEAIKLLEDILSIPEQERRCPHGRRLLMILSLGELDKFFGREL
ncbi:MAG: DNA mismatch repair endonuclease MutL [bacterium]